MPILRKISKYEAVLLVVVEEVVVVVFDLVVVVVVVLRNLGSMQLMENL